MIKVLLKKQWLSIVAFLTQGKNGKRRSQGALIGFSVLLLYGFGAMGAMFWMISEMLCGALVGAGLAWVYFAVMSLIATCLGVIGGIFMAKSTLYEAKDNDLLFSLPIPAWAVLFSRMLALYATTFVFEALVFVPALIQYYIVAGVAPLSIIGGAVLLFVMPLGALSLCNILGLFLAWLTAKLPFKNLLTIVFFIAFFVGYMLLYSKVNEYLGYVLANGEAVGTVMKTALYPFSKIGYAAMGDMASLLLVVLMFGGLFAAVYAVLSVTYFQIATMRRGERRAKYKEKARTVRSSTSALFRREWWHIIKSPTYLLNAGMGAIMMVMVSVMMVVTGDLFGITEETLTAMPALSKNIGLLVALVVCFMASSNTITACSVSLEGENIGAVQVLPVGEWSILRAKLYLHVLFTAIPAALCGGAMAFTVGLAWWETLLVLLTAVISSVMFAAMGLAVNLKLPNLHWTNEMAAVKQGASTAVALFGGWGISLLPLGGFFLFGKYMGAWAYGAICLALFVAVSALILLWIYKKGTKIFKFLN